jgi:hypothetical protein
VEQGTSRRPKETQILHARASRARRQAAEARRLRHRAGLKRRYGVCWAAGGMYNHAAVWLDHKQAKVFHLNLETFEEKVIHAAEPQHHNHQRGHLDTGRKPEEDAHFYDEIARAVSDTQVILVVGPSTAKLEFMKYVRKHNHGLESRIVGVEAMDHPTDGQIVAYARKYFLAAQRMKA